MNFVEAFLSDKKLEVLQENSGDMTSQFLERQSGKEVKTTLQRAELLARIPDLAQRCS